MWDNTSSTAYGRGGLLEVSLLTNELFNISDLNVCMKEPSPVNGITE
jgi:hypothetical protein